MFLAELEPVKYCSPLLHTRVTLPYSMSTGVGWTNRYDLIIPELELSKN